MLLTNVVNRAVAKKEAISAHKNRKEEVEQLFIDVARKHEEEFKTVFEGVFVNKYSGHLITITDHEKWDRGYRYNIEIGNSNTGYKLFIGFDANSSKGTKIIPFDYNSTNVQLILLFENALRLLASLKLGLNNG